MGPLVTYYYRFLFRFEAFDSSRGGTAPRSGAEGARGFHVKLELLQSHDARGIHLGLSLAWRLNRRFVTRLLLGLLCSK